MNGESIAELQVEHQMIALKRVYEPIDQADGRRFLVERLWPRGVRKDALVLDAWLRM